MHGVWKIVWGTVQVSRLGDITSSFLLSLAFPAAGVFLIATNRDMEIGYLNSYICFDISTLCFYMLGVVFDIFCAFNSLKPEHLRLITRKFMDDKLQYFRTIRETKTEEKSFIIPENMNVLGYSPEVVDHALLQTNTTKNGAREIRDIVERMLNQAYNSAISHDPTGQSMTGFLHLENNQIILKPEPPPTPIHIQ